MALAALWSHEQLLAGHYTAEQVDASCRLGGQNVRLLSGEISLAAYVAAVVEARRVCGDSLPFLRAQHRGCHEADAEVEAFERAEHVAWLSDPA